MQLPVMLQQAVHAANIGIKEWIKHSGIICLSGI